MLEEIKDCYSRIYKGNKKDWRERTSKKIGISEQSLRVGINGMTLGEEHRAAVLKYAKKELIRQRKMEDAALNIEVTFEEL
ncbi:MAG TPA: hypothetical protein VFM69_06380 [Pricia sp.]|nr:hypothetical protein [Pricia sp.]